MFLGVRLIGLFILDLRHLIITLAVIFFQKRKKIASKCLKNIDTTIRHLNKNIKKSAKCIYLYINCGSEIYV